MNQIKKNKEQAEWPNTARQSIGEYVITCNKKAMEELRYENYD